MCRRAHPEGASLERAAAAFGFLCDRDEVLVERPVVGGDDFRAGRRRSRSPDGGLPKDPQSDQAGVDGSAAGSAVGISTAPSASRSVTVNVLPSPDSEATVASPP